MSPYDPGIEKEMKGFYDSLSEKDKRRYVAIEAKKLGHGGQEYLAKLLDCSTRTIKRGLEELAKPETIPPDRVRRKGGGRKAYDKKNTNR